MYITVNYTHRNLAFHEFQKKSIPTGIKGVVASAEDRSRQRQIGKNAVSFPLFLLATFPAGSVTQAYQEGAFSCVQYTSPGNILKIVGSLPSSPRDRATEIVTVISRSLAFILLLNGSNVCVTINQWKKLR